MRARARLVVELADGHSVVRLLRSMPPLTLIPARTNGSSATVRLVGSAAGPLGGDDLELFVHIGPGARLTLAGIAATLALPGPHGEQSHSTVRMDLADHARVDYLPEPTVITARADHHAVLDATLAPDAELHCREMLVLGRTGERPGRLAVTTTMTRDGRAVLRQRLDVGDPTMDTNAATLAGKRVLATELHLDGVVREPASGGWWSASPLAAGGTVVTALADDTVTASRLLDDSSAPQHEGRRCSEPVLNASTQPH